MDAPVCLGYGNTLDAMRATLVLHAAVRALALDDKGNVLDATLSRLVAIQDLDLPAPAVGVPAVHTEEFTREECGFVSASAGLDGDDRVFLIHNILGQQRDLDLLQQALSLSFQAGDLVVGQVTQLG